MLGYIGRITAILALFVITPPNWAHVNERLNLSTTGMQVDNRSFSHSLSADGRFVAFRSVASSLVMGDTNNNSDIFVHDRNSGVVERVSVTLNGI